jgi:ribosome maturation factor RimP
MSATVVQKNTLLELRLKVGFARFFCFWGYGTRSNRLANMGNCDPDCRWHEGSRGGRVLRLYLDKEGGPNIDELGRVSRELSELLDAQDIVEGSYTLEVSSPGINRPLKKPEHFRRFTGKRVRIRTRDMIEGRRSFLGTLSEVTGERIKIEVEGKQYEIPFSTIEKSNYEHDWSA